MPIVGTITEITDEELLTNNMRKKTFVLLEEGPFPSELLFELYNEKISLLENFKQGDRVWIKYRPRGFSKVTEDGKVKRWTSLRPYRVNHYESVNQQLNNITEEPNNEQSK